VIAGVVAYLVVRRLKTSRAKVLTVVVAAVWAIAMGLSRVFLGHHWLTDVTVAWLIGGAWLAVLITAHQVFLATRRRPRPDSERTAAITTT
jgi:membrane-associated phospholipid phosphatase